MAVALFKGDLSRLQRLPGIRSKSSNSNVNVTGPKNWGIVDSTSNNAKVQNEET
jgi:hypothetical protein